MEVKLKKCFFALAFAIIIISLSACGEKTAGNNLDGDVGTADNSVDKGENSGEEEDNTGQEGSTYKASDTENKSGTTENAETIVSTGGENTSGSLIISEGTTLKTRIAAPSGYKRSKVPEGSLGEFLREYKMKDDGSPVLLYDGSKKNSQNVHAAVFTLPVENADLQQCADSCMRVYAEYYWQNGQYGKIAFHFTNGFLCEYSKWRDGCRVHVNGDDVAWSMDASYDDSYECFVEYMHMVFNYAGTLSMDSMESETIPLSELTIGDVIIKGGSPGHVVMVVDECEDEKGGRAFLFGQGYMPAQEFHVIKNPLHENDPWYYESEMEFPLVTAEYVFQDESMVKRLKY